MSNIKIESGSGWAKVFVDGQELKHLTNIAVDFTDLHASVVAVSIHMRESHIDLTGATLRIDGLDVPKALEDALFQYLSAKHQAPVQAIPSNPRPIEQVACRRW